MQTRLSAKNRMRIKQDPKKMFGLLARYFRDRRHLGRDQVARGIGEDSKLIRDIEHGRAPRHRKVLTRLIDKLKFPKNERDVALELINMFCPRKWIRMKLHSNFSVLRRRQARR